MDTFLCMKYQSTSFNRNLINFIRRLEFWVDNPWRRYSLFLIIFLAAYFFGSSLGMINGVLALMDPIGAFFTVLIIEAFVRFRRNNFNQKDFTITLKIMDSFRMGLMYGLLMEGFKLIN